MRTIMTHLDQNLVFLFISDSSIMCMVRMTFFIGGMGSSPWPLFLVLFILAWSLLCSLAVVEHWMFHFTHRAYCAAGKPSSPTF
jgi:hypothetical protein